MSYVDSEKCHEYTKASYYEVVGVSCDVLDLERKIVGIELYNKSATRNSKERHLFGKIADKAMKFYRTRQPFCLKLYTADERAFRTDAWIQYRV